MMTLNAIWLWMTQGVSAAAAQSATDGPPAGRSPAAPDAAPSTGGDAAPMSDIHDIKPILDMGYDWQWLIYLAGGLVVLAALLALAWWLWKRRQMPEAPLPAAPPVAPEMEAYSALDALAGENSLDPKQFYYRLSAVLRRYIERRFDFPAAEMTTEELLPRVDRMALESSLAMEFKAFCRKTDPIKFAGAAAQQERLAQDLAFSRNFVRQTTAATQAVEDSENESSDKLGVESG